MFHSKEETKMSSRNMTPDDSRPWQAGWPHNVDHVASQDPSAFARMAGGGQGAQPNKPFAVDGTKVMRIDRLENFLSALEKKKEKEEERIESRY